VQKESGEPVVLILVCSVEFEPLLCFYLVLGSLCERRSGERRSGGLLQCGSRLKAAESGFFTEKWLLFTMIVISGSILLELLCSLR
jgi:hypothetical protein